MAPSLPILGRGGQEGEFYIKIAWLGHASFRIEIGAQVLLVDPWLMGNPMLPEDRWDEPTEGRPRS